MSRIYDYKQNKESSSSHVQLSVDKQILFQQNGGIVRCMAHVLTGGTRQEAEESFLPGGEGGEGVVVVGGGVEWGSATVGLSKRGGHSTREKIFKPHPLQALI